MMKKFLRFLLKEKKVVLIRKRVILAIFLAVFLIEGLVFLKVFQIIPYERFLASIISDFLIDLTNEERSSQKLAYLKSNPVLEQAAALKAKDMAEKGYFAHTSPEGITPWYWFEKVGYNFSYAGENLAVNFIDSTILHQAWLNSPKHRANILNEKFTEIGIGTAEGIYKGRSAVFVVQLFARPRIVPFAAQAQQESFLAEKPEPLLEDSEKISEAVQDPSTVVLGEQGSAVQTEQTDQTDQTDQTEQTPLQLEIIEEKESFIAVKSLEQDLEEDESLVLASQDKEIKYSSLMVRVLSSPKTTMNFFLISLVFFAACLAAYIAFTKKFRINFYSLAVNGTIVFLIVGGSIYVNHWIFSLFGSIL